MPQLNVIVQEQEKTVGPFRKSPAETPGGAIPMPTATTAKITPVIISTTPDVPIRTVEKGTFVVDAEETHHTPSAPDMGIAQSTKLQTKGISTKYQYW